MERQSIIDIIYLSDFLDIFEDPVPKLTQIYNSLKPNGILAINFKRLGISKGIRVVLATNRFKMIKMELNSDIVFFIRGIE